MTAHPCPDTSLRALYAKLPGAHDTTERDRLLDAILDHPDYTPTIPQDPQP